MDIRSARTEDVASVLPLVRKIVELHATLDPARFDTRGDYLSGYSYWLNERAADPKSVFLVADLRGTMVAFLIGTVEDAIPIYRTARFGFIHDLWVEPDYRNEGLAKSMTLLALERFKAIGVTQVRLETAIANDIARGLFTTCGFKTTTQEMLCEL